MKSEGVTLNLISFDHTARTHQEGAAAIWTAACGSELAITPAFVAFNTRPTPGMVQSGRIALREGEPVGFVLVSAESTPSDKRQGWIDALAVAPTAQRQGVGSALLTWTQSWLKEQGCTRVWLGGSLRPFTPGLPVALGEAGRTFFLRRGFEEQGRVWDVARDLRDYLPMRVPDAVHLRPTRPGEEAMLLDFMAREFPGRWQLECELFLSEGGRASDWLLLWHEAEARPVGFCQITLEDSLRPIERFYPRRLPRPWGQFGPLGVAAAERGKGYGAAIVDGAARYLQSLGVRGCVIDWTDLTDFYGKFGFMLYREYAVMVLVNR